MLPTALSGLRRARKQRPGVEVLNEFLYRPLAQLLVPVLARRGVRPEAVVLFHTALGLLAAWQVSRGQTVAPAVLLQLKTVLDNADGQLARATSQTSAVGRYLDSEMDLLVNAALLLAIDARWGGLALVLLQLLLTADYLLEREYREARGEVFRDEPHEGQPSTLLGILRGVYAVTFEPQEKLLAPLFRQRFQAAGGTAAKRAAYTPRVVTHFAANLGLSSQLALVGVCLGLGRPRLYLHSLVVQLLALVAVQCWREAQLRRLPQLQGTP